MYAVMHVLIPTDSTQVTIPLKTARGEAINRFKEITTLRYWSERTINERIGNMLMNTLKPFSLPIRIRIVLFPLYGAGPHDYED